MPGDPWTDKACLDWCLGGASPTRPASRFLGLANGSPTSASASEITAGLVTSRFAVAFAAAGTPAGSATATNTAAVTFSFTAAATARGFNIYNASSGGTRLFYGTLSASSVMASADTLSFASGALAITLT